MEDNFDKNEFEEFLKNQVRNQRMYPSDAVWRNINKKLHDDKKWPALTLAAFTLIGTAIAICAYFFPKPNIFAIQPAVQQQNITQSVDKNNNALSNLTSHGTNKEKSKPSLLLNNNASKSDQLVFDNNSDKNGYGAVDKNKRSLSVLTKQEKALQQPAENSSKEYIASAKPAKLYKVISPDESFVSDTTLAFSTTPKKEISKKKTGAPLVNQPAVKDYNDKNMVDEFLKENQADVSLFTLKKQKSIKNKFSYQLYIAPSISYRKLLEDPSILKGLGTGPVAINHITDVNKVVRHKPGTGIEAGISIMYNLSEKFRVKSGFQFNVRQYSIEAYRSNTEVASIALIERNRIDTINTIAFYRNNNGYYSTELVNRYYQLAIPLGVEWEVIGNKKIQLNVAATIQPTYLLNHNAYLLSTNFKNYSENPEMVRSWNLNSNIETFISFKVGDFKWQIGPQLRYQPYSTFIPQYPIKEHLLDYGAKIGVSKIF